MRAMDIRQSGVALLGVMVMLILASGYYFLGHINRLANSKGRDAITNDALYQAREALLARAISDGNHPGSLPCPAPTSDGSALTPPCTTFVGWLPWRTLGLPDLRDASGERLWYVLSPAFQDGLSVINSTTSSSLKLNGSPGIAALVIAPGPSLGGQNRPSNNVIDYLDNKDGNPATSNSDGDDNYFVASTSDTFNDQTIKVDTSTLFARVTARVLGEIHYAYVASHTTLPPFADNNNDGLSDNAVNAGQFPYMNSSYAIDSPSWYSATPPRKKWYESLEYNGWFSLVNYDRIAMTIALNGQIRTLP